jgi:hypothetical protein
LDVSGEINGHKFTNPAEFHKVLETRRDDFRHAVVRKVLSYGLGRGIQGTGPSGDRRDRHKVGAEGDTFNSVILNVVKSFPFQNAKGGMPPKQRTHGQTPRPKRVCSRSAFRRRNAASDDQAPAIEPPRLASRRRL